MKIELSKRLQAVADMVAPQMKVADIGTDHAYIPIYLVEQGISQSAIAMDINEGPLERANEHIKEYGLEGQIETRLSDGMRALNEGEADVIITAGMGGALVIKILEEGKQVAHSLKACILQPQSELSKVRAYLLEEGYDFLEENMIFEDGKYYPMMKVTFTGQKKELWSQEELEYGKGLLEQAHPVLRQFLDRELQIRASIIASLKGQGTERAEERIREIENEIKGIQDILEKYYG